MSSPFSMASLSPLSPLVASALDEDTVAAADNTLLEASALGFYMMGDSALEDLGDVSSALPEDSLEDSVQGSAATSSLRRSVRHKTKRTIVTSARSSRALRAPRKAEPAARVSRSKRQTVDEVFVEVPEGESRKCSCKKSKCLKLYCECFASGVLCDSGCKCIDCSNTADNVAARRKAVAHKLSRRPKAFQSKIVATASAKDGAVHAKGCNCKRSGCQKKYCECFQGGVACNDSCKCVGCKNDGSLMHLRDLGVAGWKAPAGGFNKSAVGMISTMIVLLPGGHIEDPIPLDESEEALHRQLLMHQLQQADMRGPLEQSEASADSPTPRSTTVWPVAKPVQLTPRSGTALEPYPANQKRRCQVKTPTAFSAAVAAPAADPDGWLVELDGEAGSMLAVVEEEQAVEASSSGRSSLGTAGVEASEGACGVGIVGGVAAGVVEEIDIVCQDIVQDVAAEHVGIGYSAVHDDVEMREVEDAMADLITPRHTSQRVGTPRLTMDLLSPRSCRSSAASGSGQGTGIMVDSDDWERQINSARREEWEQMVSPRMAVAAF